MIDHTHVCEVQGCGNFDPTEGACATHPGATVLSLPQERPTKFAAVGSDGRREVVWGLGATEDGALADGRFQLGLNECESDLCVVEVSKAQVLAIENGDVSWPPDVSDVSGPMSIERCREAGQAWAQREAEACIDWEGASEWLSTYRDALPLVDTGEDCPEDAAREICQAASLEWDRIVAARALTVTDVRATFFRPSSCLHDVEGALDVDVEVELSDSRTLSGEVTMVPSHSEPTRYVAYGDCPDTWVERPFLLSLREAISGAQDVEERELLCQIEEAAHALCRESARLQGVRLDGDGFLVDGRHRSTTIDICVGDRVEAGKDEDHDTGVVRSIDGDMAVVAWDSGSRDEIDLASLRLTTERWSGGKRID